MGQRPPRIHAVVVNFNAGEWLGRCLQALSASDEALRITVLDNASSDSSLAVAEHWPDVEVIRSAQNLGFACGVNRALSGAAAQGQAEYYLIVNPDCEVAPNAPRLLREALESHPDAGICGALILDPDGGEQRACRRRRPTPMRTLVTMSGLESRGREGVNIRGPMPESPVAMEAVSGALLMIRQSCFSALNGFDEAYFLHCEDLDLFERARQAGWTVLFHPAARAWHAKGVSQRRIPWRSEWHKHRGMMRYYRRHLASELPAGTRWLWPVFIAMHYLLVTPLVVLRSRFRS